MNKLFVPIVAALGLLPLTSYAANSIDESRITPTGQVLTPDGRQYPLSGTLPLNMVVLPGGKYAIVNCSGMLQGLSVVDLNSGKEKQFVPEQMPSTGSGGAPVFIATGSSYYGLALSPDGGTLYASEGALDAVGVYLVGADAKLTFQYDIPFTSGDPATKNIIGGLAVSADGSQIYAVCTHTDKLAVCAIAKAGQSLQLPDVLVVPKYFPIAAYPYAVAVSPKTGKVFVTSYRDAVVSEVDPASGQTSTIQTGAAPDSLTFSPDGLHLWVANGDSDTLSCIDTFSGQAVSSVLVRPDLSRGLPAGGPEGMAFSKDGRMLYVAMADLNAVAALKVSPDGARASVAGFAPAGWYPASVAVSNDGSTIYCLNAKGSAAKVPNPDGPNAKGQGNNLKYILASIKGSISAIPASDFRSRRTGLYPVLANNRLSASLPPDQSAALALLKSMPIKHVIYVIKENRTYDQVLGDIKNGNGDADLTLFGAHVTPNEHAISRQFSLLDNFYCCAEVSADGWNWSTSGYASPYVQRTVAEYYREGATRAAHWANPKGVVVSGADYDYEGTNRNKEVSIKGETDVAESPGGYVWDVVAKSKLSYMNFGCFLGYGDNPPTKPALVGHTDPDFAPFDLDYSDSDAWQKLGADPPAKASFGQAAFPSRYSAWKNDFDRRVAKNDLPAFEIVRLIRDHTSGTTPGKDSPETDAADNDYAVGELVDAVSHSPYWKDTAIFVLEDDAQDGPDHVDCHRSTAYVVSAYTRRGYVDSHFYNTDSVLHTIEVLLGLSPMTRFDKTATLFQCFTSQPDLTPYNAVLPDKAIFKKNLKTAYGAELSKKMNFAVADDVDDDVLNRVLWHDIKGNAPYPATIGPDQNGK